MLKNKKINKSRGEVTITSLMVILATVFLLYVGVSIIQGTYANISSPYTIGF